MKNFYLLPVVLLTACQVGMTITSSESYEPNEQHPFGRQNPEAPAELAQFEFMVGRNNCVEQRLDNASGEWVDGSRSWDGHYFMNGFAIRDGGQSGVATNSNIRIYDEASSEWVVTFFSVPTYSSGTWRGKMESEEMVLKQPQKAPGTDIDGFSTLTFSNISLQGFDWTGAWGKRRWITGFSLLEGPVSEGRSIIVVSKLVMNS